MYPFSRRPANPAPRPESAPATPFDPSGFDDVWVSDLSNPLGCMSLCSDDASHYRGDEFGYLPSPAHPDGEHLAHRHPEADF